MNIKVNRINVTANLFYIFHGIVKLINWLTSVIFQIIQVLNPKYLFKENVLRGANFEGGHTESSRVNCIKQIMEWPESKKYPEKFITEFIDLYSTMPSLWNQGSGEYTDFEMKARDFAELLQKFREVEPEATRSYLLKKLNVWRRQYREEKHKSQEQGRPMRKKYQLFNFLPDSPPVKKKKQHRDPLDVDSASDNDEFLVSPTGGSEYIEPNPEEAGTSEMNAGYQIDLYDRFDHVTKAWTGSLLSLPRDQQIIAERIINNILFEAQVGNLSTRIPLEVSQLFLQEW